MVGDRASGGPSTSSSSNSASRSPPPRSRRCTRPGSARPEGEEVVAVKVVRPGVARGFRARPAGHARGRRAVRAVGARARPSASRSRSSTTLARSVSIEMDLRLEAAAVSELAENTRDDPDFRVPKPEWELTARDVLTIDVDRRHPPQRHRGHRGRRASTGRARAHRHPVVPAPRHPRRLLPRRHASRQSVRRRAGPARGGRFRHHGPPRHEGAAVPRRDPARLHPRAITCASPRCISRPATCRRIIRSRISRRRSAPSASRSTTAAPTRFRWRSC